jgi:hypothetical protein
MRERDDEQLLRAIAAAVRRVPPASPDLDARIMAAVRAMPEPWWRGAIDWLTATRTVRVSPVGALAYTAGLVAAVLVGAHATQQPTRSPVAAERPHTTTPAGDPAGDPVARTIRFVLVAPEAAMVTLVGDFNRWSPAATPLRSAGISGVWTVDVPLPAGRHEYAFVIDGAHWIPDPAAPRAPVADFGMPNSVVTVTPELS